MEMIFAQKKKKKGFKPPNPLWQKMKKPLMDFKKKKFCNPMDKIAFIGMTN
jgi:hypothetical protein